MVKSHVSRFNAPEFQESILDWYKTHARDLPWRTKGRRVPDPYHVWLSEIMLQQTTVATVTPYFQRFITLWPTVHDLANADEADVMREWAGLGYYARARNLYKCANIISHDLSGVFPDTVDALKKLPGIGDYTAAAIASIAFGQAACVVDGNIERVVSRLFTIETPLPEGKKAIRAKAEDVFKGVEVWGRASVRAFPQALMDIGATICTPQSPRCGICPARSFCKAGQAETATLYPVRTAKKAVPVRRGRVYWLTSPDGQLVMVQKRPNNRMLGGMTGLPTTDWDSIKIFDDKHPEWVNNIRGIEFIGNVYHVFSHFRLELEVWRGIVQDTVWNDKNMIKFTKVAIKPNFSSVIGFPTVFLKAYKMAIQQSQKDAL